MKKSFVLHHDSLNVLSKLTDEQAGQLFKAIANFNLGIDMPELDFALEMAFLPFENQFKRDAEKYNSIVDRNRKNGSKGGRPKNNPKNPVGYLETQQNPTEPKKADSDSDSDSDNVKESEKIILSSDSDIKIKPESDIPDFIRKELKPFFNLKNLSSAFQFLNSLNGEYESFKQQFFDYKLFQETSKQYKKSFGSFCNKWNETDFKASLNDLKEIKNDSEKNHFPDMQSQKVKNVNGKTVYRVIPDANGKPIINPNF